jgi:hypothetical protein
VVNFTLCRFTRWGSAPATYWTGGSVGPRAGLDAVEKRKISCLSREWNHGRPARSPSLYRLSDPSCQKYIGLMRYIYFFGYDEQYVFMKIGKTSSVNNAERLQPFTSLHVRTTYRHPRPQPDRVLLSTPFTSCASFHYILFTHGA